MNMISIPPEIEMNPTEDEILKEKALYILYALWKTRYSTLFWMIPPLFFWLPAFGIAMVIAQQVGGMVVTVLFGLLEMYLFGFFLYHLFYICPRAQRWCAQGDYRRVVENHANYLKFRTGPVARPGGRNSDGDTGDFDSGDGGDGGGDGD